MDYKINKNRSSYLTQFPVDAPQDILIPAGFESMALDFQKLIMQYNCAIREVKTKLEVLNDDLSVRNSRNPIEFIQSRVKKPESIIEKLTRRNLPVTVESMQKNLYDIAGVRVICSFVDDIYTIAEMLARQDDIEVLTVKDYIRAPKENGYRSYHMIVEVPVFFSDHKQPMKVEVQIRTIAMDFWASLEHQLKYKKTMTEEDAAEIGAKLRECAERIARTDMEMMDIRKEIEEERMIID